MRSPREDILRSIQGLAHQRISRRQKKWLRGQRNALALPLSGAILADARMCKADWNYNLFVFRRPEMARWRFVRNA